MIADLFSASLEKEIICSLIKLKSCYWTLQGNFLGRMCLYSFNTHCSVYYVLLGHVTKGTCYAFISCQISFFYLLIIHFAEKLWNVFNEEVNLHIINVAVFYFICFCFSIFLCLLSKQVVLWMHPLIWWHQRWLTSPSEPPGLPRMAQWKSTVWSTWLCPDGHKRCASLTIKKKK